MRIRFDLFTVALGSALLAAYSLPLAASDSLVDELSELTERIRSQSAADRWVVHELDQLIARHKGEAMTALLEDRFDDGDFGANPSWEVLSGEFWVDSRAVLRSTVDRDQPAPQDDGDQQQSTSDAILSLLLSELSGDQDNNQDASGDRQPPARMRTPLEAQSAFSLSIDLARFHEDGANGRFFVDLLSRGGQGLRMVVMTGDDNRVALLNLSSEENSLLERASLTDGLRRYRATRLHLSRDAQGQITLADDAQTLISVAGPEIGDLRRLALSNMQGDWGVEGIVVNGRR